MHRYVHPLALGQVRQPAERLAQYAQMQRDRVPRLVCQPSRPLDQLLAHLPVPRIARVAQRGVLAELREPAVLREQVREVQDAARGSGRAVGVGTQQALVRLVGCQEQRGQVGRSQEVQR
ncbi:hypothetical protein [Streptomyces griseorubiginosus]